MPIPVPTYGAGADLFRSLEYRRRRSLALYHPPPRLSEREMQVVALVHLGLADKEIGNALGLSGESVKTILFRIRDKLYHHFGDRPNRIHLALWWERLPALDHADILLGNA